MIGFNRKGRSEELVRRCLGRRALVVEELCSQRGKIELENCVIRAILSDTTRTLAAGNTVRVIAYHDHRAVVEPLNTCI